MSSERSSLLQKHRKDDTHRNKPNTYTQQTTLRDKVISIVPFVICFLALGLGLIGTNCPGEAMYSNQNPLCKYAMSYLFHGDEMLASMWLVLIPMFVASITVFLFHSRSPFRGDTTKGKYFSVSISVWRRVWMSWIVGGDPNMKLWSFILVACPAIYIVFDAVVHFGADIDIAKWEKEVLGLALSAGYAAVVALSFFMIPVARQSVLLTAFGLSPIQALSFHIWAGRICLVCTILHGLIFSAALGLFTMGDGRGFWAAMWNQLIPPRDCFYVSGFMSFKESDALNDGCEGEEEEEGGGEVGRRFLMNTESSATCCYGYMRNFTGFISAVALIILGITSINYIRRKNYRFFYISHIITGTAMLLGAILHFPFVAVYILPSLIYYFCTSSPVFIQMVANYFMDSGCQLTQTTIIGDSNGCAEMVFPKSSACAAVENRQAAPYVRICVPEISLLWYPFTVSTTPDDKNTHLKLLFRKYGFFTSRLFHRLNEKRGTPPIILIDGFYYGSDWVTKALQHDEIVIVTGGIGITPFLTMIRMLFDEVTSNSYSDSFPLKKILFHWVCRDEGLIRHIVKEHFSYFAKACNDCDNNGSDRYALDTSDTPFSLELVIHFTGSKDRYDSFSMMDDKLSNPERTSSDTESSSQSDSDLDASTSSLSLSKEQTTTFTRVFTNAQGTPVEAARNSLGQNTFVSLIFFSITFLVAIFFHDYYYKHYIEVYQHAAAFRGYSIYVIMIWTIIVAIVFEGIHRFSIRKVASVETESQTMSSNDKHYDPFVPVETMVALPFSGQVGKKVTIQIDMKHGRPVLTEIAGGITNAEIPGAFFCGPAKLLTNVKKEIGKCRTGFMNDCCFYEEEFEM